MKAPIIPDHWSAGEALAVYEFIDAIGEEIWNRYGLQLQQRMQDDLILGPEEIDDQVAF